MKNLFLIDGASGTGKSDLIRHIKDYKDETGFIVKGTTRKIRKYKIRESYIQDKTIIGVKPWGEEKMPQIIQDFANDIVGWNRSNVVDAIRKYT